VSFQLDKGGLFHCTALNQFTWQEHAFGTRLMNPVAAVTLRQIHSDRVLNAGGLADREAEGDALITRDAGRAIGVRTADCVPLLLLDPAHHAVAAVHAGWRGSASAIVTRTLEHMAADFGTDPSAVFVALGPCIQACCYEVGDEVAKQFGSVSGSSVHLDLPEVNRRHLLAAGVHSDHIFNSGLCTSCRPELFFSFRREPQNPGRMLTVIASYDADRRI
jgi:polyphenol oxidase